MATGQTLLDTFELVFPEWELQSGEANVAKALVALNRAQDWFESHAAQYGNLRGDSTGTVSTTASQKFTTFPSSLLRLDGLDLLDSSGNLIHTIDPTYSRGGHMSQSAGYPGFLALPSGNTGAPRIYWTNGSNIYWGPTPDAAYTVQWYGFAQKSDITASGTFEYPDIAILPFASVAAKIARVGLDDDVSQLDGIVQDSFNSLLDALSRFRRETSPALLYTRHHDT